ncbi:putative glutamine ABC transporter permease protein GlnP [Dickeya solani]|uniref:Glutamate/aspartate import permease protein GltK n=3 Tax=Dickeya solani TaxID=1089444 RepID=A0AAV3K795_9GAMM|nr:amino acid ABC transporter permease [Dickeya solani]ANE77670.1 amino acid ABC transporter permease [Dickeya solani IPO 2222]AUC41501.1 Amino acid ABC transporter, permease protein [Dickeya solani RNS 08.23.3.1.A]AUH10298.1 amino acid ABC transporter permease [Dickeya solani D s0432-1]AUH15009.1 amino acid ABC transporter permease [Dickeya solani]AYQ48747.1 putative glutamine ABC transporter permease protein GlnP [Dickeya solani]
MDDMIHILRDNGLLLLIGQYPEGPLGGIVITLILSALGIALAFPLGVLLAMARISPFPWLSRPATWMVYLVRGVPLLMFIFWVYFFVPALIGHAISGFSTMLITLVIYEGAYISEIIRAGIQGLPKGQMEASRAVGLSYIQSIKKVILPQALYNMIPALIGQFISVIKDTSLAYIISVNELTYAANQINNALLTKSFQVFFLLAIIYFILGYFLTQFSRYIERRISYKRAGIS